MQRRLGLVEFSHLDWLYTKCTYSTLVVHGWVQALHSIWVSKWPGLPLSHSFGICPSFSGSWPHPGLWYSSCIWYRYSSNTWNNFSAGMRMQWNALHFLVEQTLVHLTFIWQNVHAWFWLYTQNWTPLKIHVYQHNMAVQSSTESRYRNSFSYGTYLIIITVTHISMFKNYSFNFGRNVAKRGRNMERRRECKIAKPKFELKSFRPSSCIFYCRGRILEIGKRSCFDVHKLLLQFSSICTKHRRAYHGNPGSDLRWLVPSPLGSFRWNERIKQKLKGIGDYGL